MLRRDPQFSSVTPGAAADATGTPAGGVWTPDSRNFALLAFSAALGYGTAQSYLPSTSVDDGACAQGVSSCPAPHSGS